MSHSDLPARPTSPAPAEPQQAAQLMTHLHYVTQALAATVAQEEVFEVILSLVLEGLGGTGGVVLLVQGDQLCMTARQGQDQQGTSIWQDGPLTDHTPATDVLRTRQPLFFSHGGELVAAYPELEARTGGKAAVASAVLPMVLGEEALGSIVLDFREPHDFTAGEQQFLDTLSAQCAVALGRARLTRDLERRAQERLAALDAFVAFSEASATTTDVYALARQAMGVLRATLGEVGVGYYDLEGDLWKARVCSDNVAPEMVAVLEAGIPASAPSYAEAVRTRTVVFVPGWEAGREGVAESEPYGAGAFYPCFVGETPQGLLAMGTMRAGDWTERERSVFRAVGRSLTLALERAEQARVLEEERVALDAFARFSQAVGTETNVLALAQQAALVLRARFPDASVGYYEPEGEVWKPRVWTDDVPEERLAHLAAGLSAETPMIAEAMRARRAVFLDAQAATPHHIPHAQDFRAVANAPLLVNGEVRGVLSVGLRSTGQWGERDQAIVYAVELGLTVALERAEQARQLTAQLELLGVRTQALEAANEELEAYAYGVSHDLRTPVRHIAGFNLLLRKALAQRPDPAAERYLGVIDEAAQRMNTMIDAVLDLSRISRLPLRPTLVDLGVLVERARQDLLPDLTDREVEWVVGPLPMVAGDPDTLQQVLVNLLSNALKYSSKRDGAVVEVWAEEREGAWAVLVRDNGVGFDPSYRHKLFGVFQRLHRQEEFEGVGVGLANVRRIIQRHGGQVWAVGVPGQGATFGFTLLKAD